MAVITKPRESHKKQLMWETIFNNLHETQDFWLLNVDKKKKKTQLEVGLENGRVFQKDELLAPKNWLNEENYKTYIRRVFEIIQNFKDEKKTLDGDTDEAFEAVKEEYALIKRTLTSMNGRRKPHTIFAANKRKSGVKRGDAWHDLKEYAKESKGANQIDLPDFGLTFLKMDKDFAKGNLRYKDTPFENPNDGHLITKKAFDLAWDKAK